MDTHKTNKVIFFLVTPMIVSQATQKISV